MLVCCYYCAWVRIQLECGKKHGTRVIRSPKSWILLLNESVCLCVCVCVCVWQSYRHEDGCADAKLWPKATIFNISYMASLSPIKDLNRTITTTTAETKNWIQRRTEERVWRTVCECVCYPLAQRNRHAYIHAYIYELKTNKWTEMFKGQHAKHQK